MDTDGMQFENPIDNLTYLYDDTNKNQLLRVFDSTANPQGFSDDSDGISDTEDDYAYDDNGNMTHDDNKGITHITYNHLNLPVEIIFGTYGKIAYLYNATGQKLKKTVTEGTTITTTDYLSGFQYKNLVLQFFPHAEGYVNATEEMVVMGGTSYRFNYVFNYTDHLGNIRLSYSLDPSTKVLKIIEENHYYPFGLKHSGYNSDKMMYTKEAEVLKIKPVPPLFITSYKYKYNGKEYQDELGLNWFDYGWRNYDPAISRWVNVDPLLNDLKFTFDDSDVDEEDEEEVYEALITKLETGDGVYNVDNLNPYGYGYNNPISFDDPDGRCPACLLVVAALLYTEFANAPTLDKKADARNYNNAKALKTLPVETILKRGANLLPDVGSKPGSSTAVSPSKSNKANAIVNNSKGKNSTGETGKRRQNRLPDEGKPNTMATNKSGTTTKKYGPDGKVQKEYNKGHQGDKTPKAEKSDHVHDYKPNPNNPSGRPTRMPGRPAKPNEMSKDKYKTNGK